MNRRKFFKVAVVAGASLLGVKALPAASSRMTATEIQGLTLSKISKAKAILESFQLRVMEIWISKVQYYDLLGIPEQLELPLDGCREQSEVIEIG